MNSTSLVTLLSLHHHHHRFALPMTLRSLPSTPVVTRAQHPSLSFSADEGPGKYHEPADKGIPTRRTADETPGYRQQRGIEARVRSGTFSPSSHPHPTMRERQIH